MSFNDLPIFQLIKQGFDYVHQRQRVLAENLANVDTPKYRSQDLPNFEKSAFNTFMTKQIKMEQSHPEHISAQKKMPTFHQGEDSLAPEMSRTGNNVILEDQLMRMQDNKSYHNLASKIYKANIGFLKYAINSSSR